MTEEERVYGATANPLGTPAAAEDPTIQADPDAEHQAAIRSHDADPYADSPDAGDETACNCNGAWHARKQHCVDWPCPGCSYLCPPEPGVTD